MTKQAQNFLNLCTMESNSASSISRALSMVKPSIKDELKLHFGASSDGELANKISRNFPR